MYNKHHEVEEEAYKELRKLVGMNLTPDLIKSLTSLSKDINTRYKDEYHIEFDPIGEPVDKFVVKVTVHTVH